MIKWSRWSIHRFYPFRDLSILQLNQLTMNKPSMIHKNFSHILGYTKNQKNSCMIDWFQKRLLFQLLFLSYTSFVLNRLHTVMIHWFLDCLMWMSRDEWVSKWFNWLIDCLIDVGWLGGELVGWSALSGLVLSKLVASEQVSVWKGESFLQI